MVFQSLHRVHARDACLPQQEVCPLHGLAQDLVVPEAVCQNLFPLAGDMPVSAPPLYGLEKNQGTFSLSDYHYSVEHWCAMNDPQMCHRS